MTDTHKSIAAISLALSLIIAGWVCHSWQEAKVFNRHTGRTISTWDAMWIQLRITEDGRHEHRGRGGDKTMEERDR